VLFDLDGFKRFNDTYGHPAGDDLLRRVAQACGTVVRTTDLLARVGGEEFAVLLPACDLDSAVALADRVRAAMPEGVTCSCGAAMWDDEETSAELTQRADQALYEAKATGRDRTVAAAAPPGSGIGA
jgi:diguanylate cyclase (GGDEF)-like protein